MVDFCPKCETMLLPVSKGGKSYLVCPKCGYTKEVKEPSKYRSIVKVGAEKKTKTAVLEEVGEISKEKREKERELLQEYYEVFLETMVGEGGQEE